jgi:hypothetical protein
MINKVILKSPPHVETDKLKIKEMVDSLFLGCKELGIKIYVPRQGWAILNPDDFDYKHKDEGSILNYKVQL